jgi:hypothetical protein
LLLNSRKINKNTTSTNMAIRRGNEVKDFGYSLSYLLSIAKNKSLVEPRRRRGKSILLSNIR